MKPKFSQWFIEQKERKDDIGKLARKYTKKLGFYTLVDVIEANNSSANDATDELTTACLALDEWEKIKG